MMEGVLSGKTDLQGAGYSYVGAMENQGRTYVIALLGCGWPPHKTYKWSDARKLYTYGLEHFKMKDVFQEKPLPGSLLQGPVLEEEGAVDQVELSMMLNPDDMHLTLLMGEGEEARVVKKVPSILMAPVREGQQVGTVDYYLGEVLVKGSLFYAMQGVEKMNLRRGCGPCAGSVSGKEGRAGPLVRAPEGILEGFGRNMPGFATLFNLSYKSFVLCEVSAVLVDI